MKKFMQILLASFAVMSLVFAGCNAKKADEAMEAKDETTVTVTEETSPTVEVVTEGDVTVEVTPTDTTTAQ